MPTRRRAARRKAGTRGVAPFEPNRPAPEFVPLPLPVVLEVEVEVGEAEEVPVDVWRAIAPVVLPVSSVCTTVVSVVRKALMKMSFNGG